MPYSRRRPRIAPTARINVRLTPAQRDMFLAAAQLPRDFGHVLHRAHVRGGELAVRVNRDELDALIAAAAHAPASDRRAERDLATFVRYLETLAERFTEVDEEPADDADRDGAAGGY